MTKKIINHRVLLIGANGQLGKEIVDSKPDGAILASITHQDLDIRNKEVLIEIAELFNPTIIINASAYTNVEKAETDQVTAINVNHKGAGNIAETARFVKARMIHISTDYVFSGNHNTPYTTKDSTSPINVYGESKVLGETAVLNKLGNNCLIIRTSWLYSKYGNNFVKNILRKLRNEDFISIVGDQIGTPTHAKSLANIIWKSLAYPEFNGIQHWTNSGIASWYDFAIAIQEEMNLINLNYSKTKIVSVKTKEYPTIATRPMYSILDKTDSEKVFGQSIHWRTDLRNMLSSIKDT